MTVILIPIGAPVARLFMSIDLDRRDCLRELQEVWQPRRTRQLQCRHRSAQAARDKRRTESAAVDARWMCQGCCHGCGGDVAGMWPGCCHGCGGDVAGMWPGCWGRCGLGGGGVVAGDAAPTSPPKGGLHRISDLESRSTSTVTSLKWIQLLKISEKNGGSRHHPAPRTHRRPVRPPPG